MANSALRVSHGLEHGARAGTETADPLDHHLGRPFTQGARVEWNDLGVRRTGGGEREIADHAEPDRSVAELIEDLKHTNRSPTRGVGTRSGGGLQNASSSI